MARFATDPVDQHLAEIVDHLREQVALADGWVVVPEEREGIPVDEIVAVERWEGEP